MHRCFLNPPLLSRHFFPGSGPTHPAMVYSARAHYSPSRHSFPDSGPTHTPLQIEHHMFPCINHCHLPALQVKVMALCEKHGVKYDHVSGYKEAFARHVEHTTAMGIRPFSEGHEH